jgi:hypothetical protein
MLRVTWRLAILAVATLLLAACADADDTTGAGDTASAGTTGVEVTPIPSAVAGTTVVVHRTEACSCCGTYEEYLEAAGFTVEQRIHEDLTEVKAGFGIPDGHGSCHTNEVAGYAAEGHLPVEALLRLIEEAPEVDGISLAGMPAGSPGMPGEQQAPFVVHSFVDGQVVGEFGRF